MNRQTLIQALEKSGVARTAFYASLNCLKEMGLVEDRARERGREKIAVLTEKGRDVAIKVREITMILEASDEPI